MSEKRIPIIPKCDFDEDELCGTGHNANYCQLCLFAKAIKELRKLRKKLSRFRCIETDIL